MTKLIDADALSEKLCETTIFIKDGEVFQHMINDAPTIDAVEVVRCANCKYLGIKDLVYGYCKYRMTGIVMPDDYCSHGERREP